MSSVDEEVVPLTCEFRLLSAVGLADDEVVAACAERAVRAEVDWGRFEELARGHGMTAIAGARLAQAAPGTMPEQLAAALRQAERRHGVLQLSQTAAAAELSARLASAGVRSIVLKGVALSHLLYQPAPHWRAASDVDILVHPDDFMEADRLLQDTGYARIWPETELPGSGIDMFLHLANAFNYLGPSSGQLIELHHRPTLNPYWLSATFEELHAESIEIATACGPVRGLWGADLLAYLSWHALGHAGYRLKWFCDIARALRHPAISIVSERMRREHRPVALALAVVEAIAPSDDADLDARSDVQWQRDVRRIVADMENVSDLPTARSLAGLPAELVNQWFLMKLTPSMRAKAYQLLRTASDPRDVQVLKLGRRATALYAALGPMLALKRWIAPRHEALR